MNNKTNVIAYLALFLSIIIGGFVYFSQPVTKPSFGAAQGRDGFSSARIVLVAASSTTATTTTSGSNASRTYLYIANVGGNTVTCNNTTSTVVANTGWVLPASNAANSRLEFDKSVVDVGQIWCISNTGTSSIAVVEE